MSHQDTESPKGTPGQTRSPKRLPLKKRLLFTFITILLGLSPLVLLEISCHVFGWGQPTYFDDPYVGFSDIHPLFVLNEEMNRYEIPPSRLKFFCPESFAADKPVEQYRIFVLGGSTVQGRPYEIHTSFTAWLELSLQTAEPSREWEVVNCGGISYASYRLVPILEEVLNYEPDLIIICTGHNEFLEDRTYQHIKQASPLVAWPAQQIARLRTYNLLRGGYLSLTNQDQPSPDRPVLSSEVDARLDFKGGMDAYHRDEAWRESVIDHFEYNLKRMVDICRRAEVPVLFVCPVSALDWPPFKSEHREDLSAADKKAFDALIHQAQQLPSADKVGHIDLLEQARVLDDRYALLHYELAQWYLSTKQFPLAKKSLEKALVEDICPLRMLPSMRDIMLRVAKDTQTPLVDMQAIFTAQHPHGIPGKRWLVDHVHPKIKGHKLVADELFATLEQQNIVHPVPGWETTRLEAYENQIKNLDPGYFPRGKLRLDGLNNWAAGKVPLERPGP